MLMELAQSVDLDGAVIYPDGLTNSCRLLEAKEGLVDQIKYVAHFPRSFCYWLSRKLYSSDELACCAVLLCPAHRLRAWPADCGGEREFAQNVRNVLLQFVGRGGTVRLTRNEGNEDPALCS